MEVCGTHTMAIARHGLRALFPAGVTLLSGPGCPVCVTPVEDIDRAILLARAPGVTIASFGDMLRVPGSGSSLEKERSAGADIRVVYSPVDAVRIAEETPARHIVFIGVGFETTAPAVAAAVRFARAHAVKNFSVLSFFKTVPAALRALLNDRDFRIRGFLLPGHVSTIIGASPYRFIADEFGIPGVIAGFEPKLITDAVTALASLAKNERAEIVNMYPSLVKNEGNGSALRLLREVFVPCDASWRGMGIIPASGLSFAKKYRQFDADSRFDIPKLSASPVKGCLCGEILKGRATPRRCPQFGKRCTPSDPLGPCMVSTEGACAAEYKYGRIITN